AHISDIHQGLHYAGPSPSSRFDDINRILDWTADRLIAEKVDLCLIAGDCFKDAKVMFDRGTEETICIGIWLRKLSTAGIEVIVISGTPSHDSVAGYKFLKEMQIPYVRILTQPMIMTARFGSQVLEGSEEVYVACLPGLNRSSLLTQEEYKGLPPEQVHRIMTDKITQLCMGMAAQMPNDKPKILMAHMTYQGADKGFDDLLMQHEPILTREAVQGFDLVCLGHIHRPQVIDNKVFYSGPVERLSFNEQDITPGFWIHELGGNQYFDSIGSCFIETPARRYVTLEWGEGSLNNYIDGEYISENLQDAIVRLHYSCSEETAQQLNRKQLEKSLYDAGAFFVTEIKADIERSDRARDNTVNESLSVPQALEKWCVNQNIDELEIKELVSMTSGLMEG
ncbi:MAG: exonuclease subunit SbcD, partial [Syntrophomonadaceae bacterium]|nr:exonuclease subunit SbcD [Syntrophomonadaceae bacterium]